MREEGRVGEKREEGERGAYGGGRYMYRGVREGEK